MSKRSLNGLEVLSPASCALVPWRLRERANRPQHVVGKLCDLLVDHLRRVADDTCLPRCCRSLVSCSVPCRMPGSGTLPNSVGDLRLERIKSGQGSPLLLCFGASRCKREPCSDAGEGVLLTEALGAEPLGQQAHKARDARRPSRLDDDINLAGSEAGGGDGAV